MDTFAGRLRWCLDQTGLTRWTVAAETGLKEVTIFRLADGVRGKAPQPETVKAVSAALAVPAAWLAFGEGDLPDVHALCARAAALAAKHKAKLRDHAEPPEPEPEEVTVDRAPEFAQPDGEVTP